MALRVDCHPTALAKESNKQSIKDWVCSMLKTGYIHKSHVYTEKEMECTYELAYCVVIHLLEDFQDVGRVLHADNFIPIPYLSFL